MIELSQAKLTSLIIHKVGNKIREEGIQLSEKEVSLKDPILLHLLLKYFLFHFTNETNYRFIHETDIELNEMYSYSERFFDSSLDFKQLSEKISKHLYENTVHPSIKGGEIYVAKFDNIFFEDEMISAYGIFKSENKDTYLKISQDDGNLLVNQDKGINVNKLDKGCLVFNTDKEQGYLIRAIDNVSKGEDLAKYWVSNFLGITRKEDIHFKTERVIEHFTKFIHRQPTVDEIDKAVVLGKTYRYLSESANFDLEEFESEVLDNFELRDSYKAFHDESDFSITDGFQLANKAVSTSKKKFSKPIMLDKNFKIQILNPSANFQKGYDETRQLKYYQFYFTEEK